MDEILLDLIINPYIYSNNHYEKFKGCLEMIKHPDILPAFRRSKREFGRYYRLYLNSDKILAKYIWRKYIRSPQRYKKGKKVGKRKMKTVPVFNRAMYDEDRWISWDI